MIYLDSSVALAQVFNELRRPTPSFSLSLFMSSRLLQFEVWNRLHAREVGSYRLQRAHDVLGRVKYVEFGGASHARALRPFPIPVRTLDGLHLAAMDYLREQGATLTLASYDLRLIAAAEALGFPTLQP